MQTPYFIPIEKLTIHIDVIGGDDGDSMVGQDYSESESQEPSFNYNLIPYGNDELEYVPPAQVIEKY